MASHFPTLLQPFAPVERVPVRKDTILLSSFDIFDSGIKCTGSSVGRQEPVTLSSHVVIIGVSLLLRGGGDSSCA